MKRKSSSAGPSQRQLRVGETIRRALSEILSRGVLHDPVFANASVTVSEARPTPDLRSATVFVSSLGGRDEEEVVAALQRSAPILRSEVARLVQLKHAPQLKFRLDTAFDRYAETARLLSDERVRRDVEKSDSDPEESL